MKDENCKKLNEEKGSATSRMNLIRFEAPHRTNVGHIAKVYGPLPAFDLPCSDDRI